MARPGITSPDLVATLAALQARVDALERKPIPQTLFDQYPAVEWGAQARPLVSDNVWTSCGIANVTGLKYDRLETRYITDLIETGRSEAEVRMAAFRYDPMSSSKVCVTASDTFRLSGLGAGVRNVGAGTFRWIHGVAFGWNFGDTDDGVYTVELQHRNPDNMHQKPESPGSLTQVYGYFKLNSQADNWPDGLVGDDSGEYYAPAKGKVGAGVGNVPAADWVTVPNTTPLWDGAYAISNMHYCAGMPQDRLPDATTGGKAIMIGSAIAKVRAANTTEGFFPV